MKHDEFMQEAIRIAGESVRSGRGGPFGAVVVKDGDIIGRGWNQVTKTNDPTAHAEMVAIRAASKHLGNFRLDGCILYASCEPCPMCFGALYWARLQQVYFAGTREDAAAAGFDDAHIYREMALPPERRAVSMQQILRAEAQAVFAEWNRKVDKVPY